MHRQLLPTLLKCFYFWFCFWFDNWFCHWGLSIKVSKIDEWSTFDTDRYSLGLVVHLMLLLQLCIPHRFVKLLFFSLFCDLSIIILLWNFRNLGEFFDRVKNFVLETFHLIWIQLSCVFVLIAILILFDVVFCKVGFFVIYLVVFVTTSAGFFVAWVMLLLKFLKFAANF